MLTGIFRLLLDGLAALTYMAAGLSREHNGHNYLMHPVTGAVGSCRLVWVLRRPQCIASALSSKHKAGRRRRHRDELDSIQTTIIGR